MSQRHRPCLYVLDLFVSLGAGGQLQLRALTFFIFQKEQIVWFWKKQKFKFFKIRYCNIDFLRYCQKGQAILNNPLLHNYP
jgi:hypothetical protein